MKTNDKTGGSAQRDDVTQRTTLQGCGDCDPCIGGRPEQCAVGAIEIVDEHAKPEGHGLKMPLRREQSEYFDSTRYAFAISVSRLRTPEEQKAVRDFILRACNSHDVLVAACQHVLNSCDHPDKAVRARLVDLAPIRAALAVAEGKEASS